MNLWLTNLQILISIFLITVVMLQVKGGGLGSTFGGSAAYARTRRGSERVLFRATIILAIVFVVIAIANGVWL